MNNEDQMTPDASTERANAIARDALDALIQAAHCIEEHYAPDSACFHKRYYELSAKLSESAAIQRGDGQMDDVKPRDLEQFKIETFRHAGNVIFNQLNEAGFLFGTAQGKEALFTAQRVADLIVHSPHSTALLNSSNPPSAKPDETSGATPNTVCPRTEAEWQSYQQYSDDHFRYRMVRYTFVALMEDELNRVRRELNAVRKSAGAEGAEAWKLGTHLLNGGPSIRMSCETVASWEGDATAFAQQIVEAHNDAKSTPGVDDEDAARLDWLEEQSALCEEADGTRYNEWRVEMPPEFRGDVRDAIDQLRAKPADAAKPSDGASGGKEGV